MQRADSHVQGILPSVENYPEKAKAQNGLASETHTHARAVENRVGLHSTKYKQRHEVFCIVDWLSTSTINYNQNDYKHV